MPRLIESADNGLPKVTIPIVSPGLKICALTTIIIHLPNNLLILIQ